MDNSARKNEVMIRLIPSRVIVFAGLWLAQPAAAQFEIAPEHFDDAATAVVRPPPRGSMRISLPHKYVQRHRVRAIRGTKESSGHAANVVQFGARPPPQSLWC